MFVGSTAARIPTTSTTSTTTKAATIPRIVAAPAIAEASASALASKFASVTVAEMTTTMTTTKTTTTSYDDTTKTCATLRTSATTSAPTRTTITSDPGILCFHHCNVKVFCFTLPHICPNCKAKLDTTDDETDVDINADANIVLERVGDNDEDIGPTNGIGALNRRHRCIDGSTVTTTKVLLPFRLPYPFVRASQYPCAIVLRPTTGDFLNDYNNATDLHIAVTTSTGTVVEFDRHGLRQHRTESMAEWWQCLLVGDVPEPWYDYWDDILLQLCKQTTRWSTAAYHEDTHNCYTFVLAFLQALAYDKLSEAAHSKTTFCEKYIVPRTTTAGKYISLYRKLRDTGGGIYVHPYVSKRQQQQLQQQMHHRGKVRGGYIKPPTLTASSGTKKTSKAMNSTTSCITPRSPALCTIEE